MRLDELIAAAAEDPSKEQLALNRLLISTLYVHAPVDKKGPTLSVVQFKTPNGNLAIPVFTDLGKAEHAGRGKVRIVAVHGRELFAATLGATLVINPNDAWCMLYPEEIAQLLVGKSLARTPEQIKLASDLKLRRPAKLHSELIELISTVLIPIPHAKEAWLTEAAESDEAPTTSQVILVTAEAPHHERIARALASAMSACPSNKWGTVDITFLESASQRQEWLLHQRDCLVFSREWHSLHGTHKPGHA